MERRNFLKRLAAGAVAITLAPRAALAGVVAPERTIKVGGVPVGPGGKCVYQAHFNTLADQWMVVFPEPVLVRQIAVRLNVPSSATPFRDGRSVPMPSSVALMWLEG